MHTNESTNKRNAKWVSRYNDGKKCHIVRAVSDILMVVVSPQFSTINSWIIQHPKQLGLANNSSTKNCVCFSEQKAIRRQGTEKPDRNTIWKRLRKPNLWDCVHFARNAFFCVAKSNIKITQIHCQRTRKKKREHKPKSRPFRSVLFCSGLFRLPSDLQA